MRESFLSLETPSDSLPPARLCLPVMLVVAMDPHTAPSGSRTMNCSSTTQLMMSSVTSSTLFCQKLPSGGILELLGEDELVAKLTECQCMETQAMLFQSASDPLQNSPLHV